MARKPKGKQVRDADGRVVAVRGKAANGEGSVYAVDGGTRWRATWREAGRLRSVSGTTREKVLIRRAERMAAGPRVKGQLTDTSTVAELAAWWLDTVARHRVRPSTLPKYEDHVRRLGDMGDLPVRGLTPEHVATWQAGQLASGLAPKTVANARAILRQVLAQGVELGVLGSNPVDRVKPPKPQRTDAAALTPTEARRLIAAAAPDRLGAAVALLFVQGWRVSEVLGLAWTDLDLEAGTATIRRAAVYVDGVGATLGPPKTEGAHGRHHLAPGVVQALAERRRRQEIEQANAGGAWRTVVYGDAPVALVFTQHDGSIVLRQAVTKVIKKAAVAAGIDPALVSTHTGRRTVVTALYASEGVDLADIARHVGHSRTATTEGYVRQLGQRPKHTAEAAARALDAVG